jgi:hypothetical protein
MRKTKTLEDDLAAGKAWLTRDVEGEKRWSFFVL